VQGFFVFFRAKTGLEKTLAVKTTDFYSLTSQTREGSGIRPGNEAMSKY
jgi:hypothetical protein